MAGNRSHLPAVVALARDLEDAGATPVLVGGMALAILGSQRVTLDFDLNIPADGPSTDGLVDIMYRHGFELITKFRPTGEVQRTVDTAAVAKIKLRVEPPVTIRFYHWKMILLVDLMRDFPVPARDLMAHATTVRLAYGSIRIASREDLLRLKEMAFLDRKAGKDAQDLEFLREILSK